MNTRIFITVIVFTCACTYSVAKIKPTFWLSNRDATMPVVVRGNLSSHTLIVFLHGGPGGTAMKKIGTRAFSLLEEDYGIVYWNQRGADFSLGGRKKERMTLGQYIEDLDVLIDCLKITYPESAIYLMGHCWGGGFGTAYLIDESHQSKIAGWIDVAGAHNNPMGDSLSVAWVKNYAEKMIANRTDILYWKRALYWYQHNPSFDSNQLGHYSFVRKSHGYQLVNGDSLGKSPCYTKMDLLLKPVKYLGYYANYYRTLSAFLISDIDLTPEMSHIKIPSLIIWGEEDGLIPVAMAYEAYYSLGTSPTQKQLITLPHTAHTVFYEQPMLFKAAVKTFIDHNNLLIQL